MTLSPAQKEAYARAENSTIQMHSLEMRHTVFPSTLRYVPYKTDINLPVEDNAPVDGGTTQTFSALAFRTDDFSITSEPDSTITMALDGVSGIVQPYIAAAILTYIPIECTLRPFSYNTKTNTVGEMLGVYHMQARNTRMNISTVSITLGHINSANRAFPGVIYDPESNPGLI